MRTVSLTKLLPAALLLAAAICVGCGYIGFDGLGAPGSDDGSVPGDASGEGAPSASPSGDGDTGDGDTGDGSVSDGSVGDGDTGDGDMVDGSTSGQDAAPEGGPSATCGNGVVEAGEQCDDGSASATCDADCTFASCGDGTLNVLAGEACDDGGVLTACTVDCQIPICRNGCACEFYNGVRYMFCAEQLAREPARAACEMFGMGLVRIASGSEHTYLRWRSQQLGFPKFHLGATDGNPEGTWVWDDGTVFWQGGAAGAPVNGAFSAWAVGEPNAFTEDENCSEVQSLQGWNDCVCDLAKPFVCKDARAPRPSCGNGVVDPGEACDDGGQSATCDADCSLAVCGDGVVNTAAGEKCDHGGNGTSCAPDCSATVCPAGCTCQSIAGRQIAFCSAALSFRDAGVACGLAGMKLAPVTSPAINNALRRAAGDASADELWIGVFDIDEPNRWVRSDLSRAWQGTAGGTSFGHTNFASGAPAGTANQDCVAVLANGEWQTRDCAEQKPYACERL